jgi:peptidoglycan/xylan/chitin deacetylase (PgdA/CDA1 family)
VISAFECVKRSLKLAISLLVHAYDLTRRALSRTPPPRCIVLYYHAVPAAHRELFARQMDVLLQWARPLPTEPATKLEPGQRYAVVTFDDGFLSVLENAAPELTRRRIPWTIFVPSGCLGQTPAWLRTAHPAARNDRVMIADELRALVNDPLVTVGSHTVNHAHLVEIGPDRAGVELSQSKADLERILGRSVDRFSYPFGARTPALDEQARALGYRRLFSINPAPAFRTPDELVTGRVSVDPDISHFEFRLKLLGAYRWLARRDH